jgi:hypothetical protein
MSCNIVLDFCVLDSVCSISVWRMEELKEMVQKSMVVSYICSVESCVTLDELVVSS